MRIGIDARLQHYRPGGISEAVRQMVTELAILDQDSQYFVLHNIRGSETIAPAPNIHRVNTITPAHHRLERWALSVELLRYRLDILHSPDIIPPQRGARYHVITIHDLHFLHFPQFMTAESLRYYQGQVGWAVRHADHILVSSQATLNDLGTFLNVPAEKITVRKLGVNAAFKPLLASEMAGHRQRLNLPETYLLFVGTFEPRKNIPGLFTAYHRLRQERSDLPPLVLVGRRGWLYEEIFATARDLNLDGHLIWIENAPWKDLPALYNGARLLVLPSYYEGFGLTALEAMACGTPPIVANRSSLPEVVGDTGLLVDPDDPDSIADAIARLLDDDTLHSQLSAAGQRRAATFTWRHTAESALNVYRSLVSQ